MSQTFLGLNSASHDTGIAIVEDTGKINFAISEERLSRIKKDSSFPRKSLNYAEKNFKVDEIVLPQIRNINFRLRALHLSLNAFLNNKSANIVNMWFNKLLKNMKAIVFNLLRIAGSGTFIHLDHQKIQVISISYPMVFSWISAGILLLIPVIFKNPNMKEAAETATCTHSSQMIALL